MWMGGTVPLGYDVKDRKLVINAEEAEQVGLIFRRYLALGCVSALQEDLKKRAIRSKRRTLTSGQVLGGCSFGRGALYHLLQNRIYRGEVVHHGVAYSGEQERIVDEGLWNAVQTKLEENRGTRRRSRVETGALLGGLIFDARGNLMSPTYSIRRGNRYRYYVSRALMRDRKRGAGSRGRFAADEVERLTVETLSRQLCRPKLLSEVASGNWSIETRTLVQEIVERVTVGNDMLQIVCKLRAMDQDASPRTWTVPLPIQRPRARQEIVIPGGRNRASRYIHHALVLAIARAKTWMCGLRSGTYADTMEIARRFRLNDAHVRRLLRFGYLAPDILEAIVEGRQPRSLTVKRLLQGIPCMWSEQRAAFGFASWAC